MGLPTVAIIGGGFSGLIAAIQLKKRLGIYAQIFEATSDLGGVWNYNTYPGCTCDIPSHLYSFSSDPNPNWSQQFSSQKEIHEYIQGVCRKHNLYEQTEFETKVIRATWIEDRKKWELELHQPTIQKENRIEYFDFMFGCIGNLRIPYVPEQFKSFQGKIFHSAYWDNDYDFNNKTVAIIGSGASAVQIIPSLAPIAKHLHSFQRTATWVAPRMQTNFSNLTKLMFNYVPFTMYLYRNFIYYFRDFVFSFFQVSNPESKRSQFFGDVIKNSMTKILESHNRPDLIEKLIPNIPLGCKRGTISNDYLQSLCRENVTVNTSSISDIQGQTITTSDGAEATVDVLCLATGFNVGGFLGDLQINGRNGANLNKVWDEDTAKTYKTVNVHGFPNYFILLGPGSGSGHHSLVSMAEIQVDYCVEMISYMMKNQITCLEPTQKAQEVFCSNLQQSFQGTIWQRCNSWYVNKHGQVQAMWPSTMRKFRQMLGRTNHEEYIKEFNTL